MVFFTVAQEARCLSPAKLIHVVLSHGEQFFYLLEINESLMFIAVFGERMVEFTN